MAPGSLEQQVREFFKAEFSDSKYGKGDFSLEAILEERGGLTLQGQIDYAKHLARASAASVLVLAQRLDNESGGAV